MKLNILITLVVACMTTSAIAQNHSSWITYPDAADGLSISDYFNSQKEVLGVSSQSTFPTVKERKDNLGFTHIKTHQHHEDVPVEGAIFILHTKDGTVSHANGLLVKGKFANSRPSIDVDMAFESMRLHYASYNLYFEDDAKETLIKTIKNDRAATFKPKGILTFVDEQYTSDAENYRLAWKFEVYVDKEIDREIVFVDAHTGHVLFTQQGSSSGCFHDDHEHNCEHSPANTAVGPSQGLGVTRYIGEVAITTDSVSSDRYTLRDDTRGLGIETFDMNRSTDVSQAVSFVDEDNYWDLTNTEKDEAAIDAHHGAQMTYDFWFESYDWNSFDGNGSPMLCYIHWDVNWFNASWNGMFSRYGDGRGDPLTYIDIVAHEFTHGLTGTTAGLVYADESGALNESFSDIFGSAVEHFADVPTFSWNLGIPGAPFRDMSNPNRLGHPDTYFGNNWFTASTDNGGVHTNSGVQNFWYYLLVNGGSGTNDNGDDYDVDSLGWEKASAIAFRNLTTYLTPSSQYYDARLGALQAAADLYGLCSFEVEVVAKAWAAVGVGGPTLDVDLQMLEVTQIESSCDLSNVQDLGIRFRFNPSGCGRTLSIGDSAIVGYRVTNGPMVTEKIYFDREIAEGEVIDYTFETSVDLSTPGLYELDYWVHLDEDSYSDNDTIFRQTVRNPITLEDNTKITFRTFTKPLDSFYLINRRHSETELFISSKNPKPGLIALSMTGIDANPNNVTFPTSEDDNFVLNPEYLSAMCYCIDATDWQNLFASFDIRQTFSDVYLQFIGFDVPQFVSSMRITANGEQIGPQYHPVTYIDDDWDNQVVDLSDYAGDFVEVCFEGKHFLDRQTDEGAGGTTQGDYTYLDNIEFFGKGGLSSNDLAQVPLVIRPNPASDQLSVSAEILESDDLVIKVIDVTGRVLMASELTVSNGTLDASLDVSHLNKGLYTIILEGAKYFGTQKVVIE